MSEGVYDITTGQPVTDEAPMTDTERDELLARLEPVEQSLRDHAAELSKPNHDTV